MGPRGYNLRQQVEAEVASACEWQGASCAVALNPLAFAGKVPPPVAYNELLEPPSLTAARHAAQWCNNVLPVRRRPLPPCSVLRKYNLRGIK